LSTRDSKPNPVPSIIIIDYQNATVQIKIFKMPLRKFPAQQ
jgi:hypothetical protein